MADRETVIKGLEKVWDAFNAMEHELYADYVFDALELLKEQEVNRKEEVCMLMEVIPVTIGNDYRTWFCSACSAKLQYKKDMRCPKCHRRIDWEGR